MWNVLALCPAVDPVSKCARILKDVHWIVLVFKNSQDKTTPFGSWSKSCRTLHLPLIIRSHAVSLLSRCSSEAGGPVLLNSYNLFCMSSHRWVSPLAVSAPPFVWSRALGDVIRRVTAASHTPHQHPLRGTNPRSPKSSRTPTLKVHWVTETQHVLYILSCLSRLKSSAALQWINAWRYVEVNN